MSFLLKSPASSEHDATELVGTKGRRGGHHRKRPHLSLRAHHHTSSPGKSGLQNDQSATGGTAIHESSSSLLRFYPECCNSICNCLRKPKPGEGRFTKFREIVYCPPSGPLARFLSFTLLFFLAWLCLWLLFGSVADFNGPIFALIFLEFSGLVLGMCIKKIHLPALLGPLIFGVILRNGFCYTDLFRNFEGNDRYNCTGEDNRSLEIISMAEHMSTLWIKPIREISLAIILTRAGLELSPKQLKKLSYAVPLLAFTPCIMESLTCATLFYFIFKPPFLMALVGGFALAAVSPAVVVPGMLSLNRKGYGVEQGVGTLLIAASSIDDVLAISLFTVCLNMMVLQAESSADDVMPTTLMTTMAGGDILDPDYRSDNWTTELTFATDATTILSTTTSNSTRAQDTKNAEIWMYCSGPLSLLIGIVYGSLIGMFLHFIPPRDMKAKAKFRLCILLLINIAAVIGFGHVPLLEGAGSLGVLVTSFIASFGWRSQVGWKAPLEQIEKILALIWTLAVPLLFGTIGKEIKLRNNAGKESREIGIVFGIIFACLTVRCVVTYFVGYSAKVGWKERIFIAMAWIPKATVQAALAPLALSKLEALPQDNPQREGLVHHAHLIVNMAVFAILLTAPVGAVLISLMGPKLLKRVLIIVDEFPNGEEVIDGDSKTTHYIVSPDGTFDINSPISTEILGPSTGSTGTTSLDTSTVTSVDDLKNKP